MKILLLTDVPPCKNYPGSLVSDQLCRFLPENSVVCFAVVNPAIPDAKLSADLAWIPIKYAKKPREASLAQMFPVFLRKGITGLAIKFLAYGFELWNDYKTRTHLVAEAIKFGQQHHVDRIWAILQGQTIIRMALPLAKKLNVPLYTQVWDPFGWWLRANEIDNFSKKKLLKIFDETLSKSKSCGVASFNMSVEYQNKYAIPTVPIISSLSEQIIVPPAQRMNDSKDFVIGMAGQFYALSEWQTLLTMLDQCDWRINNKNVRIKVLGRSFNMFASRQTNIEYLGWRSQEEAIRCLADADLLYLPYWFSEDFKEEARLSFPSKLVTYFAAGRPIIFHGPDYASPSIYLTVNKAGFICNSTDPEQLKKTLEEIIANNDQYQEVILNSRAALHRDFTLEKLQENFYQFINN